MFFRKIIENLKLWASSEDRKPLILRGARQVGKTTVVNLFAKDFDQYIYLNLELSADRELFERNLSIDELILAIFFHKGILRKKNNKVLLFIDEIQNSQFAVATLRYFYENAKNIFVIGAGSLLEAKLGSHISFPVGRVEYMWMHPLSFEEYLSAIGEQQMHDVLLDGSIQRAFHEKILKSFYQYVLLGGMPEVIQKFIKNDDLIAVNKVYSSLINGYLDDVEKYADFESNSTIIRHVIHSVPYMAGKRIKFQGFGQSNYSSKDIKEALLLLQKAMLIQLVYPCTSTELPIIPDYKKSPKLLFLDTGIINYVVGLQGQYFNLQNLNSLYQGFVAEHIVGQELLVGCNSFDKQLNFWVREKKQSTAEVDYIFRFEDKIIPIEVKFGKTGTLRSLHQFMKEANHDFAIRFCSDFIRLDEVQVTNKAYRLLTLPYYLAGNISNYIAKYI